MGPGLMAGRNRMDSNHRPYSCFAAMGPGLMAGRNETGTGTGHLSGDAPQWGPA